MSGFRKEQAGIGLTCCCIFVATAAALAALMNATTRLGPAPASAETGAPITQSLFATPQVLRGADVMNAAVDGSMDDGRQPVSPPSPAPDAETLKILRTGTKIKIRGLLASEDDRRVLLGIVVASFPGLAIQDNAVVRPGAPKHDAWLAAVSFTVRHLALLSAGRAEIAGAVLTFKGVAGTADSYETVQKALVADPPQGLTIARESSVRPPASEEAYIWLVQWRQGSLSISGHMPDEAARRKLMEAARSLFPRAVIDDETRLAVGAPQEWTSAALVSLLALRQLHAGSVLLNEKRMKIDGLPAGTEAVENIDALDDQLPGGFAMENEVTPPVQTQFDAPAAPAAFSSE